MRPRIAFEIAGLFSKKRRQDEHALQKLRETE